MQPPGVAQLSRITLAVGQLATRYCHLHVVNKRVLPSWTIQPQQHRIKYATYIMYTCGLQMEQTICFPLSIYCTAENSKVRDLLLSLACNMIYCNVHDTYCMYTETFYFMILHFWNLVCVCHTCHTHIY